MGVISLLKDCMSASIIPKKPQRLNPPDSHETKKKPKFGQKKGSTQNTNTQKSGRMNF
jgi:hypothetical protein